MLIQFHHDDLAKYRWRFLTTYGVGGCTSDSPQPNKPGIYLVSFNRNPGVMKIIRYDEDTEDVLVYFYYIKDIRRLL